MPALNSAEDIERILTDVRKAYRLLYLYQRRVMDIVKFIADITSRRYEGGWSKFSNSSPKDGKGSLDNWAWDWLNMYCYEFFLGDKVINNQTISLSVWLVSDTGYYDKPNSVETELNSFSTVEESATKLVMVVGKNIWHTIFDDFESNLKGIPCDYKKTTNEGILLARSFSLSSFINADQTHINLKTFANFCEANGIPELTILS